MKILHIIHALQKSAGTSLFCVELCRHLRASGHDVLIVCQGVVEYECGEVAVKVISACDQITYEPDIVHIHGLWDYFMHQSMKWCQEHNYPYAISLHGCLMPHALSRSYWKKKLALSFYLKSDLKNAKLLHVTSELEKKECDKLRLGPESVIVPIGCDLPIITKQSKSEPRSVLFLSRISPEKGLFNLLHAWEKIDTNGWQLVIAGPDWRGHLSDVRALVVSRGIKNISFPGPVYGEEKDALYKKATLFIMPSFTENFSAVVAEALSYALPVITTKGTPWFELPLEGCGWWVDFNVNGVRDALDEAMHLSNSELAAMGIKGRTLVEREYSWSVVKDDILSMYNSILTMKPEKQ
ncbi:MAG: glycosyltransferase [Kiritimatiellae bacterium]|nr:glycosyltransferase [Kiritimatiellia bacterium]